MEEDEVISWNTGGRAVEVEGNKQKYNSTPQQRGRGTIRNTQNTNSSIEKELLDLFVGYQYSYGIHKGDTHLFRKISAVLSLKTMTDH